MSPRDKSVVPSIFLLFPFFSIKICAFQCLFGRRPLPRRTAVVVAPRSSTPPLSTQHSLPISHRSSDAGGLLLIESLARPAFRERIAHLLCLICPCSRPCLFLPDLHVVMLIKSSSVVHDVWVPLLSLFEGLCLSSPCFCCFKCL